MSVSTEFSRKMFAHSATWMCFNILKKCSLLYLRDFESSVSHCLGPSDSDTLCSVPECPTSTNLDPNYKHSGLTVEEKKKTQ
jgi:hypothetical protein